MDSFLDAKRDSISSSPPLLLEVVCCVLGFGFDLVLEMGILSVDFVFFGLLMLNTILILGCTLLVAGFH